jgi:hypothetical protein
MESTTMFTNAVDHSFEHPGEWAISVASAAGWTAHDLACAAPFRNRQMRVSTVAAVRSLGHDVIPSGKAPHATLRLVEEPSEELWEALRGVFGPPEKNPRYGDEEV